MSVDNVDFEQAGKDLIEILAISKAFGPSFQNCDQIWRHPTTKASVYVGDISAAQSRETLESRGITHIVNCQEANSKNFFEDDPKFVYLRFPIAEWKSSPGVDTNEGIIEYFKNLFTFVDNATLQGQSVLIHCFAGAHRAGASGIAFLMHACNLDFREARALAKKCRSVISPFSHLLEILVKLDNAHREAKKSKSTKLVTTSSTSSTTTATTGTTTTIIEK
eukprot:c17670_g1_i1.p1 GENE.c17670_g1_i1~~c17670_g1_i1.p1  ORF type:complete len:221 (+),score=94.20 c17670_g1_i1:264-926(+)